MKSKLLAGLLVGAVSLVAGLSAPAEARNNDQQQLLNQIAMQNFYNQQLSKQYGAYGQYAAYGGLNPNDPNYFKEMQYQQWLASQGNRGGFTNSNHGGFTNSNHGGFINTNFRNTLNNLSGYAGYDGYNNGYNNGFNNSSNFNRLHTCH